MKNPLHLQFYIPIVGFALLLIGGSLMVLSSKNFSSIDSSVNKKKNGIPGSMRAMDLWSDMRTYPYQTMDASSFSTSFQQANHMSASTINGMLGVFSPTSAPWAALGPKNFAGRILSIAFHPTDPNMMWVGSASGGLWKTTTGGTGAPGGINWQYVPTQFPVLGVSSIVIHPTKPDTMYIGTGEVYSSNVAATGTIGAGHVRTFRGSYGIGILKTTDGGTTWSKVLDFANSNLKGVMDLAIHPTNADTVFAATTDGLYRTFNGGTTWTLIHNITLAMDLCFKPGNPNVLYVGSGNFGSTGAGIYKTTNANAVTPSFTKLTTGLPAVSGKIQLSISSNNTSKIYASIGRNPNVSSDPCGLYYSTDEGINWTATSFIGTSSKVTNQGWYAHDIAAHPANANTILWGELDTWRSTNTGTAFTQVGFWSNWDVNNVTIGTLMEGVNDNYVHADIHRIQFSPHDATGNTVFLCTDGGIFRSTDGGQNYETLNGGLMTAQIYSNMAISKTDANFMVGGLQDNEGFIYSGTTGSKRIPSLGDGFHCAINTRDDDTCYITGYYFNLKRSTNRGATFASPSPAVSLGNPPSETACFNTPFVLAASNPNIMYAGSYRIKKSINRGATWTNTTSALFNTTCPILYIAVAPTDPNTVYISVAPAGAIRSKLLKTTDGGSTYSEITGALPDRYYSDIVVDDIDPNRVAVTLSGFGESHVFMSNDGGSSWSDLGTGLTDVPHNTLMFDPNERRTLYVGNDLGVFYANNVPTGVLGATTALTWIAYNEGFDDASMVSDLLVTNTNKLRVATYGRGLWERDLAPSSNLPVVFKQFDVLPSLAGNQLRWIISSQSNVDRYEIEYSTDGLNFHKIGAVPGRTSVNDITYTYLHVIQNDVNGFYRIRNVDQDESYTYSSVEMVKANKMVSKLVAYPNPTSGLFKIKFPFGVKETMKLILYDNTGRLVMLKNIDVQQRTEIPVDISKLSRGTYQVVCEGGKIRWMTSILKK